MLGPQDLPEVVVAVDALHRHRRGEAGELVVRRPEGVGATTWAGWLLTGLVVSLGTAWGLVRHYWVLFKLLIAAFCTIVLLMYMATFRSMADVAADPGAVWHDGAGGADRHDPVAVHDHRTIGHGRTGHGQDDIGRVGGQHRVARASITVPVCGMPGSRRGTARPDRGLPRSHPTGGHP